MSSLGTRIEMTKSPVETSRVTTTKNPKVIHTSAGKVILTFFFDQDGPLLIDFQQRGTTVNAQGYSQTLTTLRQAFKSKRPGKLTRLVFLLHDNARPHTANTITALLQKFKWEVLGNPPYSPDFYPCDYAIFGLINKAVRSKQFTLDDEVKQYVRSWLTTQPREFYEQPFTVLCRSGTSASTARANTSDIQVLVSVPRPPVRFFLNAPHN